jgi:hypothetical protein
MSVATPEWLARRGGEVRQSTLGPWVVYFDRQPQYVLTPVPVAGKHGCQVVQSINGRRLDDGSSFASAEDAVWGGLEDLRKALGW